MKELKETTCKIQEKNTAFLTLKAECLIKLLESDEAMKVLEKALSIDPKCKEAYPLKGFFKLKNLLIKRLNFIKKGKILGST